MFIFIEWIKTSGLMILVSGYDLHIIILIALGLVNMRVYKMDEELHFSLCYEQLIRIAGREIRNCFPPEGEANRNRAEKIYEFWYTLARDGALCGQTLIKIENDAQYLKSLFIKDMNDNK